MECTRSKTNFFLCMKRELIFICCSFMVLMAFIMIYQEQVYGYLLPVQTPQTSLLKPSKRFYDHLLPVQTPQTTLLNSSKQESGIKFGIEKASLKVDAPKVSILKPDKQESTKVKTRLDIAILAVVDRPDTDKDFKIARDSLSCYAKIQNYTLEVVYTNNNLNFSKLCPHKEFMLKRHCIAARIIPKYDWLLFLDADIGVINPHHRIEEYIDESVNIIFYDRFYDWEVATGSYLAKNSTYSIEFLNKLADFEYRLPASFHGIDNGIIHLLFMEELAPNAVIERQFCERLLNKSKDFGDLFAYEACARMVFGANRHWAGKLKIITKGIGWTRDGWLTKTKFCSKDFMFHGWKQSKLGGEWVLPFEKSDDLAKCANGFASWTINPGFNTSVQEIEATLRRKYVQVEKNFLEAVGRLANEIVK